MRIELRPAQPQDLPQLYAITASAMRSYVEQAFGPWVEDFQRTVIANSFDPATHRFIHVDGALAGVVAVAEFGDHIQLEKLYLLPDVQGRGVGSQVLRDLLQAAERQQKTLRLRVLEVNTSARRFYERHGFVVTQCVPPRCFMQYPR